MSGIRYEINFWNVFLLMCSIALSGISCGDIPPEITKCHPGEGPCIVKAINDVLRLYPKGNPAFGLKPLDVVHVDHLSVPNRPGDNPIQLNIEFFNLTAYGVDKIIVDRVEGFEKDPKKSKFEVYGTIPDFRMEGQYELNGKMLLLPIKGKGNSKISLKNLKAGLKVKVSDYRKDGKLFIKVDKMRAIVQTDLLRVNFENLLGENNEVGSTINNAINENWRDVWVELEDSIAKAFATVAKQLVSDVLESLSYDDFFKED